MHTADSPSAVIDSAIRNQETLTTEKALELFDALDVVDLNFMMGRWQGVGIATHHPMDGLLEASNWYGKEFIDPDHVHPLLITDPNGNIIKVAPNATAMSWIFKIPLPRDLDHPLLQTVLGGLNAVLKTEESQARLRMMEYRGKVTATMIYDYLPINDSFRKVDDNRVLGVMDYKEIDQPFFFALTREHQR